MTLPITRHASGRAAPLPEPGPEPEVVQPPAEAKTAEPDQVVIPADESDDPDVATPMTDDATAAEIAAAVDRFRRGAELAQERAASDQATAETLLEDARREAARIIADAEAQARPFIESGADATKEAADLTERGEYLARAAVLAAKAEDAEGRVQDLEDERADLTARHADLGQRMAVRASERQEAEAALATAEENEDIDGASATRGRIASIDGIIETLRGKQTLLQERLDAIGDGTETFSNRPLLKVMPLLARTREEARNTRRDTRESLNMAYPSRPQAVEDRLELERAQTERYNREWREAEAAREQAAQPRTFIRL